MRPQTAFSKVPMAAAAWSIGRGERPTTVTEAAVLVAMLVAFQAVMWVVNDLLDAERDRTSAPYLPLPSGIVGRRHALGLAALLGAVFLGGLVTLAGRALDLALALAAVPAALATMKLYGRTKGAWFSPLLASSASFSAPFWVWICAGHRGVAPFALLFAVTSLHGVHANLRAQLRDIEGDPKAGTVTLAVRLGARRTFWLAVAVRLVELAGVAALALGWGVAAGVLWLIPVVALLAVGLAGARRVYARTRDRVGQTAALGLWVYISWLTEIAILGAFHPRLAAVAAVVMFTWFTGVRRGYYHRLVSGRLAARWRAA